MIVIYILVYIVLIFVLESYETLRCYSCREEKQCGRTFSSDVMGKKIVFGDDLYDSCSITVNSNDVISRDLIPAHTCRSSSYQFCCNQDLCNSLPSPPLPALTTLSCANGICGMTDDRCNNSIIYLSSATESCARRDGENIQLSYRLGCSPNKRAIISSKNELMSEELFCCNSPACNKQHLSSEVAIRCYTCDSRITGFEGCSILNTSSVHVYNSGSSSRSESCAMIVGLAGTDPVTNENYSTFTIRTFIDNCVNQSFGNVTYGGASFQGRIDCCSTSLCNIHPLYTNITFHVTTADDYELRLAKRIVFIAIVCLGSIFILMGLSLSICRIRLRKSDDHQIPCVISDGATVLFLPVNSPKI